MFIWVIWIFLKADLHDTICRIDVATSRDHYYSSQNFLATCNTEFVTRQVARAGTLRTEPNFLAHAENRLCGIPVLFPLSMRCQLPSYNIVGSHFNHRLTVVNSIKTGCFVQTLGRSKTRIPQSLLSLVLSV